VQVVPTRRDRAWPPTALSSLRSIPAEGATLGSQHESRSGGNELTAEQVTAGEPRARLAHLRERGQAAEVRPIELFFDLVYVLAVTQLTRHLIDNLTLRGTLETLILLLAVWGAWTHIAWITNYFSLGDRPARLVLIGLMLASLIMSSSLFGAFDDHGLAFAGALSTSLLGGQATVLVAVGRQHALAAVFERVLIWWVPVSVLLIAGGLVDGDARLALWLIALTVLYLATWTGFPLPRLGRSLTTDYTIAGEHMAHRCYLFVTIALGESILVIGSQFGELPRASSTVAAFVIAFISSVAFWWIYFDRSADAAIEVMATATDPGRLGLTGYTYFHLPLVAGVIVAAAGYEVAIAQPDNALNVATACLILGGPALFLVGQTLFKWSLWGHVPLDRLAAIGAVLVLIPVAVVSTVLVLLSLATTVVVAAAWLSSRGRAPGGDAR
jgi:low temperature requirement protein LtrA